jgi:small subunit ribosomal protein S8e
MTKLGAKRIHTVRVRGGNTKHRALRLETGNYAWGSEHATRKTRIIGVVYNASNNELVRTNTLVKGAIVQIDAAPFRQWYEAHYHQPISKKAKVRFVRSVSGRKFILLCTGPERRGGQGGRHPVRGQAEED